jgi:hypothetical protein
VYGTPLVHILDRRGPGLLNGRILMKTLGTYGNITYN